MSAPPKHSNDVIIVGAGPAGAILAYTLTGRGVGVLLLEKETLPRYKCCAGGVTEKAARLLDFDISGVIEQTIDRVDLTYRLSRRYRGQHGEPIVYTVTRHAFDHLLVRKAQERGTVLADGRKVTRIRPAGDLLEVSAGGEAFCSPIVVGADGAYSVVARELGMPGTAEHLAGIATEIVASPAEMAQWRSRAQLELGCIPGGYAWVFPRRTHLSVGVGCVTSRAKHLEQSHREFLHLLGFEGSRVSRSRSHLIPTCGRGRFVWQDRALLVGDAAGLADPLTGEGIHNAVLSAQLAAPVIETALAHGRPMLQAYQEAVEEQIVSELKIARVLSRLFIRFPHLSLGMLHRSDGVWKAGCGLISGDLSYADIRTKAGGFKGIAGRLFRI